MISNEPDMKIVATASTGREGIQKRREIKPDITLMDLRLPDISGIDVMLAIQAECPDARIILLTMFAGDVEIQRALQAGAQGYLLKGMPPERMVETIRQVHAGKRRVSRTLVISEETVKVHVKHIMEKLGATDRTHAIAIAACGLYFPPPGPSIFSSEDEPGGE